MHNGTICQLRGATDTHTWANKAAVTWKLCKQSTRAIWRPYLVFHQRKFRRSYNQQMLSSYQPWKTTNKRISRFFKVCIEFPDHKLFSNDQNDELLVQTRLKPIRAPSVNLGRGPLPISLGLTTWDWPLGTERLAWAPQRLPRLDMVKTGLSWSHVVTFISKPLDKCSVDSISQTTRLLFVDLFSTDLHVLLVSQITINIHRMFLNVSGMSWLPLENSVYKCGYLGVSC